MMSCVVYILYNFMYVYYLKNFSCKRDGQIKGKGGGGLKTPHIYYVGIRKMKTSFVIIKYMYTIY